MGMITSIRVHLPVAEAVALPAAPEPRSPAAHADSVGPVAATTLVQAVQQASPKPGGGSAQLLEARMTAETAAAVAADAARDAYIKASIAAGISPLPLP